jgi:hypothetical protein
MVRDLIYRDTYVKVVIKFYDNNSSLPRMRNNTKVIVTSLNLYYSGLSMRKVVEQIENIFEDHISQSTIHYWIHKTQHL